MQIIERLRVRRHHRRRLVTHQRWVDDIVNVSLRRWRRRGGTAVEPRRADGRLHFARPGARWRRREVNARHFQRHPIIFRQFPITEQIKNWTTTIEFDLDVNDSILYERHPVLKRFNSFDVSSLGRGRGVSLWVTGRDRGGDSLNVCISFYDRLFADSSAMLWGFYSFYESLRTSMKCN